MYWLCTECVYFCRLHPTQSLQEQGVDEKEVLLLKKKFFVTDANVDRSDPIQLHLLYVQVRDSPLSLSFMYTYISPSCFYNSSDAHQCRDAITHGHTPVSLNEAYALAALNLQVFLRRQSIHDASLLTSPVQVEQGNYNPARDVKGSLKERLPKLLSPQCLKQAKEPEKEIFGEWKKLSGMTEINAKFRYGNP